MAATPSASPQLGRAGAPDFPSSHMASWGCGRGETLFFPSPVTRSCTASYTTQNNTSAASQSCVIYPSPTFPGAAPKWSVSSLPPGPGLAPKLGVFLVRRHGTFTALALPFLDIPSSEDQRRRPLYSQRRPLVRKSTVAPPTAERTRFRRCSCTLFLFACEPFVLGVRNRTQKLCSVHSLPEPRVALTPSPGHHHSLQPSDALSSSPVCRHSRLPADLTRGILAVHGRGALWFRSR